MIYILCCIAKMNFMVMIALMKLSLGDNFGSAAFVHDNKIVLLMLVIYNRAIF